jgi:hypothetical protein
MSDKKRGVGARFMIPIVFRQKTIGYLRDVVVLDGD